jgi:hypothetical protein
MTPGDPTQSGPSAVRPTRMMTPRAQLARVLVGATFAILVGAGPAIAWDVSTQPPRAEAPSPWPQPSPWKGAGEHLKDAMKGIARVYLPRSKRPTAEQETVPTLPAPSAAPSIAPAVVGIYVPPSPAPSPSTTYWVE